MSSKYMNSDYCILFMVSRCQRSGHICDMGENEAIRPNHRLNSTKNFLMSLTRCQAVHLRYNTKGSVFEIALHATCIDCIPGNLYDLSSPPGVITK